MKKHLLLLLALFMPLFVLPSCSDDSDDGMDVDPNSQTNRFFMANGTKLYTYGDYIDIGPVYDLEDDGQFSKIYLVGYPRLNDEDPDLYGFNFYFKVKDDDLVVGKDYSECDNFYVYVVQPECIPAGYSKDSGYFRCKQVYDDKAVFEFDITFTFDPNIITAYTFDGIKTFNLKGEMLFDEWDF